MKKQLQAVDEFHRLFECERATEPCLVSETTAKLRHKLMEEENQEYLDACKENNLVKIADALGDKFYILCGTILTHGMQHVIEECFDEIHRSNLSKLGPDGKPMRREDGKVIKGPNYIPPNLNPIISKYLEDKQ